MSGAEIPAAMALMEGAGAAGAAAMATPIATTAATGAGLTAGAGAGAALGAGAGAAGMGQGLIAPALAEGSMGLMAGAPEVAGMGAQGLTGGMAATGTNAAAPFATAAPTTFNTPFTVGDGLAKLGKGAEYASKMNSAMGAMSPQQKPVPPARQMQQIPNQSMAGLLGNPDAATQARVMKLKRLGLLG